MAPADIPLWEAFLRQYGANYDRFVYDTQVGEGTPPPPDIPEFAKKDWQDLTKKRIDAIGFKSTAVEIFEVKPRAGLTALGQLLGYKQLYTQSFPISGPITISLITSMLTPDERSVYDRYNIKTYILEAIT